MLSLFYCPAEALPAKLPSAISLAVFCIPEVYYETCHDDEVENQSLRKEWYLNTIDQAEDLVDGAAPLGTRGYRVSLHTVTEDFETQFK